ncbi:CBN-NTH-1 protein [Aphelenchoides avenae]|nr:CBN-NTH-1 protein [Aphelenchus avenae]
MLLPCSVSESGALTVEQIIDVPEVDLADVLRGVSFHKTKAANMKKVARILKEQYESDIPNTFEGLCSLPGIGPKMAHLTMQIAFDVCVGIAVDTHVHRIVNRLRWVNTKTPEQTSTELCKVLPESHWRTINKLLVGFGQQTCHAISPKCDDCTLKDVCPASEAGKKKKGKKRAVVMEATLLESPEKKLNI